MQNRYQTDYPNQIHQLTIAVSKHYYVTRDGQVRWQKKPFEVNLTNHHETGKTHIVNYIVRDHFSGMFFAALAHTSAIREAEDFLTEAWSPKAGYPFDGVPDSLVVSKSYVQAFPRLMTFLEREDVRVIEATSGFQAGVRDVPTWERYLEIPMALAEHRGHAPTFAMLAKEAVSICRMVCDSDSRSGRESKVPRYLNNRPRCRYPGARPGAVNPGGPGI